MEFISYLWIFPFLGIIFSMSFLPILCGEFWDKYETYIPLFWLSIYLFFVFYYFGCLSAILAVLHPIFDDYVPFIFLVSALYIISGGIFVDFPRGYGAVFNTAFLFFGSCIAGLIGTTGASALLIRPFLRVNMKRKYKTHLMVFFIFLISNIGGAATPLGDPPLFIGFLKGIDFFWFIKRLYRILFSTTAVLCLIFFVIDTILFKLDSRVSHNCEDKRSFEIQGLQNAALMLLVLLSVILCNFKGCFILCGEKFSYSSILRNFLLFVISFISMKITPKKIREKNNFSFKPIKEIAELFAGIFITVTPIINMLHQGANGKFKCLFDWMTSNGEFVASRCFWVSGLASSILDNAPTFLIFFYLTSGDPNILMTLKSNILAAFSISTVFMGAMTYIGNAPNLIVKSVAVNYGIKVPSFLGYMAWSVSILLPIFIVISHFL